MAEESSRFSRRALFAGAVGLSGLALAACTPQKPEVVHTPQPTVPVAAGVDAHGDTQAGIARPTPPQGLVLFEAYRAHVTKADLAEFGALITELTADASDLTITVGIGASVARSLYGVELSDLPEFAGDSVGDARDGDLAVQICVSDPGVLGPASAAIGTWLTARGATLRWSQSGFRGAQSYAGVNTNLFGFHEGIINPRGEDKLAESVWADGSGTISLTNASYLVVRRLKLDVAAFSTLPAAAQDAIFGRHRDSGAPLSGGTLMDEIDLAAKQPDGEYVIPRGAHARVAHPAATGYPLMMRRAYSFLDGAQPGLLFMAYQQDPQQFIQTQLQMDANDSLLQYVSCTGSGGYLVLPGFTASRALGA